ncbi:response regulator [Shewanella sp. SNU WT4]|uniref:hybrid sensor histidine kinase/response regulator n=1 Tax=Shewanella sp. SNU WT4 TaxID=2590015 RepID=UPI00112A7111|nr:response regulator [Shewanella sp. SNU WT4]QDF67120.1 response regulator [Shewanella sp. SNU WT4]
MNIQNKISFTFVLLTTVSVGLLTYIATDNAVGSLKSEVENTLNSIADYKAMQFYDHIENHEEGLSSFASNPWTAEALSKLSASFKLGVDSDDYKTTDAFYRDGFSQILARMGGYDIFLINPEGDVVFSIAHETDFATNLKTGAYKDTLLAESFDDAATLLETKTSEFKPYSPSQWNLKQDQAKPQAQPISTNKAGIELHSAFIAAPVFQGEALIGVLAFQVNTDRYNDLSADYSGLKQTGEVVIGKLEDNYATVITPLRRSASAAFNLSYPIGSALAVPLQRAVQGERGSGLSVDYKGDKVLAAWRAIPELNFGFVVKVDVAEAFAAAEQLKIKLLLIGLLISVIAGLTAFYISRKISYPIQMLLKAVVKIAAGGNFNEKITITANDETEELAQAFNVMNQKRFEYEASLKASHLETQKALADLAKQKFALDQHAIVAITDVRGNITFVNNKFCEISGFSETELLGQNHRLLNSGHHDPQFFKDMYRSISRGITWNAEICNQAKDGHLYWVHTTIVPFMNSANKPESYIAIRTDITASKLAEVSIQMAKEEAESANRAKSEFLANMSHEIRTPMNGVIGMNNLLLDTNLNAEQHNYAKTVKSSAESLLTLLNDILDFSKIEAGKLELEAIDFDFEQMISELSKAIALQAHDKNLELISPASPLLHQWFCADPGRLRQILTNLLGNAIKFTERGEVAVYYSVQQQSETHSWVRFDITDTGIGLSEEQQRGLFDRFSQADGSTTRKYGGTGLGLAICKQLVEMMGGEIGVTSVLGKGSTFWFTLNLARAKAQPPEPVRTDLTAQKLLIVDDNATNGRLLEQLLSHWQIDHLWVDNAAAALVALHDAANEGDPYTIAIIDRQMPTMDGLQLGRAIKADLSINTTRLLLLNTSGQRSDAQKFEAAGFDGFHNKPIEQSLLYNELLKVARITPESVESASQHTGRELPQFNARVLVVEDNMTNQLVAKGLLSKFAVRIDVANNGQEALIALTKTAYDLVFMDCQMPVMDGYEASRHIRDEQSQVQNHAIPIIAMTANAMQGDRELCLGAGMSDYIAKPIDPAKLQRALSEWLPAHCQLAASETEQGSSLHQRHLR